MASKNNAAKAAKKQAAATAKADKKAAATAKVAADKATQTATYGTGSSLTGMDTASQVGLQQKLNREQQTFTDDQNARNQTNAYGDTTTTERNPATGRLETKVTMNAADKAFQDTANAGRNQAQTDFNAQGQYKGQDPTPISAGISKPFSTTHKDGRVWPMRLELCGTARTSSRWQMPKLPKPMHKLAAATKAPRRATLAP